MVAVIAPGFVKCALLTLTNQHGPWLNVKHRKPSPLAKGKK